MTLTQIINTTKENFTKARALYAIISSMKFIELFNLASEESRNEVLSYINNHNKKKIQIWIYKESGEVPTFRLRNLCRKQGIKNYNRSTPRVLMLQLRRLLTEEEIFSALFQ